MAAAGWIFATVGAQPPGLGCSARPSPCWPPAYGLVAVDVEHQLPRVLAGALVQLLAVLVLSGIAMALFGCDHG